VRAAIERLEEWLDPVNPPGYFGDAIERHKNDIQLVCREARKAQELEGDITTCQERIYKVCEKYYPDVDGAGSDGGWVDFTVCEVEKTLGVMEDKAQWYKEALVNIVDYHKIAHAQLAAQTMHDEAREALKDE
jgi:hypothetical protein